MTNGSNGEPATATAPISDIESMFHELNGLHPALDKVLLGLVELAEAELTLDETSAILAAAAGDTADGIDLLNMVGKVIAKIGDSAHSKALRALPPHRARSVYDNTSVFAAYLTTWPPRELLSEASWDSEPDDHIGS